MMKYQKRKGAASERKLLETRTAIAACAAHPKQPPSDAAAISASVASARVISGTVMRILHFHVGRSKRAISACALASAPSLAATTRA